MDWDGFYLSYLFPGGSEADAAWKTIWPSWILSMKDSLAKSHIRFKSERHVALGKLYSASSVC